MVTVANGKKSDVLGKVMDGPVIIEQCEARIDFVMLQDVPFDPVVGCPNLKRFGGVLHFRSEEVFLDCCTQQAFFPLVSEYEKWQAPTDNTDSEDCTSDSDRAELSENKNKRPEKEDRELVLTIHHQKSVVNDEISGETSKDFKEQVGSRMKKQLSHLPMAKKEENAST